MLDPSKVWNAFRFIADEISITVPVPNDSNFSKFLYVYMYDPTVQFIPPGWSREKVLAGTINTQIKRDDPMPPHPPHHHHRHRYYSHHHYYNLLSPPSQTPPPTPPFHHLFHHLLFSHPRQRHLSHPHLSHHHHLISYRNQSNRKKPVETVESRQFQWWKTHYEWHFGDFPCPRAQCEKLGIQSIQKVSSFHGDPLPSVL